MPTITTKNAGIGPDADPKPVTGFNYAGQPMKPGEPYNGRPEFMTSDTPDSTSEISSVTDESQAVRLSRAHRRKKSSWTAEKREAFAKRMRDWHARRKQEQTS